MHRADTETHGLPAGDETDDSPDRAPRARPVSAFQPDIVPPAESSTAQAAKLLGVDKKTVRKYIDGGLLEWRDIAPPGSSRPVFRIRMDSVLRLRTSYRTGPPAGAVPAHPLRPARRRPAAPMPKLKHVTLRN